MHTKEIRLIAMDMDGTLLDRSQRIAPQEQEALKAAREKGVALAICSGRMPGDIARFLRDAGMQDCAVLSLNGAYCLTCPPQGVFVNETLQESALKQCVDAMLAAGVTFGCFSQNRLAVVPGGFREDRNEWGTHWDGFYAPEYFYGLDAFWRIASEGANKLLCMAHDEAVIAGIRRTFEPIAGLSVTSSWVLNLELMPAGVNKGTAVAAMAQKLGLDAGQVMAIGDYDNDVPMLAYAGVGVAMGNASPAARSAASFTTLSNAQHGVAEAIRRYVL